ncbi:MAG: alpha/beta fold hydrolase [Candidatus Hermodarchaeota archaeon]
MPFIEYLTRNIYYQIKDLETDKAIIFIHGSGGNSDIWKEQLNIDVNYKLITMDLPSHGESDEFDQLNLELYTNVVQKLITVLNLKHVIIAGHSLGGAVAQNLYFTLPNLISGLILIGTGGRLRVSPVILNTIKQNYQEYLKTLFIKAFSRKTDLKIIKEARQEASRVPASVTYSDFFICDKFDVLEKIELILVPCLIIVGRQDNLTPVKYSEFFHNKITQSDLQIIEDAGHMVMIEKPNEVNEVIKQFLIKYFK